MTTVTIGRINPEEKPNEAITEAKPEEKAEREVPCFSSPVPVRRKIPFRFILIAQLALSAVMLAAVIFGGEEFSAEVRRMFCG